jgi:hypothetical protein
VAVLGPETSAVGGRGRGYLRRIGPTTHAQTSSPGSGSPVPLTGFELHAASLDDFGRTGRAVRGGSGSQRRYRAAQLRPRHQSWQWLGHPGLRLPRTSWTTPGARRPRQRHPPPAGVVVVDVGAPGVQMMPVFRRGYWLDSAEDSGFIRAGLGRVTHYPRNESSWNGPAHRVHCPDLNTSVPQSGQFNSSPSAAMLIFRWIAAIQHDWRTVARSTRSILLTASPSPSAVPSA